MIWTDLTLSLKGGFKVSQDLVQRWGEMDNLYWLAKGRTSLKLRAAQPHMLQLAQQRSTNTRSMTQLHAKGILLHDNLLPLNMAQHKGGARLHPPFCSLLCTTVSLIASTLLFDSLSHTHNPAPLIYLPHPMCLLIACSHSLPPLSSLSISLPHSFFLTSSSAWGSIEDSQQ